MPSARPGGAGAEIMVPLIAIKPELDAVKAIIDKTAEAVAAETGETIAYTVGTMIELPRAALKAARSPKQRSSSRPVQRSRADSARHFAR